MTEKTLITNTKIALETRHFHLLSKELIQDWIEGNRIKTFISIINFVRFPNNLFDSKTDEDLRDWINSFLNNYIEIKNKIYTEDELIMFKAYLFYAIKNAIISTIPDTENPLITDMDYIDSLISKEVEIGTEEWFCQSELRCQLLLVLIRDPYLMENEEKVVTLMNIIDSEAEAKQQFESNYINN